jgi:SAM-dependent methyltransferase
MLASEHAAVRSARSDDSLEAVRDFWERHPLFSGESRHDVGTVEFFEDHERTTLHEFGGSLDPIFTRDIQAGRAVLDVGCGIGFWVTQFARCNGAEISACDLTHTAVRLTRRRLELFGLTATVEPGNAEELPYADASFDHINCQGVIHHTPSIQRCLSEFHRILKPGGTLCFSVYYKTWFLRSRVLFRLVAGLARPWIQLRGRGREGMLDVSTPEELIRLYDGRDNPIGRAYTRAEVQRLLRGKFEVLEHGRFGFPRRVLPVKWPDAVQRVLSRRLGLMVVFRCRKPAPTRGVGVFQAEVG